MPRNRESYVQFINEPVTEKPRRERHGPPLVYMVLDKSGSMEDVKGETIHGYNTFIAAQAKAAPNAKFALTLFDTRVSHPYAGLSITEVPLMTTKTYRPDGWTALHDAMGQAIRDIDQLPEKPSKVLLVVFTDGEDNSSREFSKSSVAALIRSREGRRFQVLYLGANQDAFSESASYGISIGHTVHWTPTVRGGTISAYNVMAESGAKYMAGVTHTASLSQSDYDSALRTFTGGSVPPTTVVMDPNTGGAAPDQS